MPFTSMPLQRKAANAQGSQRKGHVRIELDIFRLLKSLFDSSKVRAASKFESELRRPLENSGIKVMQRVVTEQLR